MSNSVFVAVYGSLRSGMENEGVNHQAGAESLGEGFTQNKYRLSQYGRAYFPVVSLTEEKTPLRVEVWKTNEKGLTNNYDMLEGYPSFYNRTQIPVILDSGEKIDAWIYHIDDLRQHGVEVESGDWKVFKNIN